MTNNQDLKRFFELSKERNEIEYLWVKQVISIIAIILGLIVSLKSQPSKNIIEYIMFVSSILLNGLCILSGLIFLYAESDTLHSLVSEYKKHIESPLKNDEQKVIQVSRKKIYDILRVCFFVFLVLSILSLIIFVSYSSLPL